jgi:hypothetical protein
MDELEVRFTYHPPAPDQPAKYRTIRGMGLDLAETIEGLCPESRERALAITKLEEAVMWANAAIARRS